MLASKITILQGKVIRLFCRTMGMLRRTFIKSTRTVKKKIFYLKICFWKLKMMLA